MSAEMVRCPSSACRNGQVQVRRKNGDVTWETCTVCSGAGQIPK